MNSPLSRTAVATRARISGANASTGATIPFTIPAVPARARIESSKRIDRAVYAYLQAIRSLGHRHVKPEDVAAALGISVTAALAALTVLRSKGVTRAK